jgi:hypothetical protein
MTVSVPALPSRTQPSRAQAVLGAEHPGVVEKRRSLIAALTIALTLSLCGTALAAPLPSQVSSPAVGSQSGATEQTSSDASSAALSPGTAADSDAAPAVSSGGGLGALVIVVISVGGAVALAGMAYTATRFGHRGHPAPS